MTTNNRVKAPRPCTLPKGWTDKGMAFKTVTFDSNKFQALTVTKLDSNSFRLILEADIVRYSEVMSSHDILQLQMQTIQAIASAQRPWLKAEGFEFDTCVDYIVLCEPKDRPYIAQHHHTTDTGEHFFTVDGKYTIGAIVAFKPISDSQEAWKAVEHVEVYKESTNDTQTNG